MSGLARDDRGVTAIEYGLIAGMIAVVIVGSLASSGGVLNDAFTSVETALVDGNSAFKGGEPPADPVPDAPDPGGLPNSGPGGSDLDDPPVGNDPAEDSTP